MNRGLFGSEDPGTDFGRTVRARPTAVHRVASVADLSALLARIGDAPSVRPRARAHSVDGQTVTSGRLVDMSRLRGVDAPAPVAGRPCVRAEAGATWRDVLRATLPSGLAPPVVVDHLDLTVAGTLSMGGLGATSWRHGLQADHVVRAVVYERGGVARAVERGDPLLDRVLCGQGLHGILAEATLALDVAPEALDRWTVTVHSHRRLLELHEELIATGLPVWIDGGGVPAGDGGVPGDGRWRWTAGVAVDASRATAVAAVRERVEVFRRRVPGTDVAHDRPGFLAHLDRAGARLRADHDQGAWGVMAHPRTQLVLPRAGGLPLLDGWLADPAVRRGLGSGSVLLYAVDIRRLRRLGFRGGDGQGFLVGWQRTCDPGDTDGVAAALTQGRAMGEAAVEVGGVQYPAPSSATRGAPDDAAATTRGRPSGG